MASTCQPLRAGEGGGVLTGQHPPSGLDNKKYSSFLCFVVLHLEFVESLLSLGETKPSVPSSSAGASPHSLFLPSSPSENQLATANCMFKCFCLGPQVVYARALRS